MVSKNAPLDAVVIGSGPNGLAAGIALARAGRSVRIYEAERTIGGGARSAALTLPGYVHDTGSAVHALLLASPFLRSLPLNEFGLELAHPGAPFAHPLHGGSAVVVEKSIDATVEGLSTHDGRAYRRLVQPLVHDFDHIMTALLGPFGFRHPLAMAKFSRHAIRSIQGLAHSRFKDERTRAMFAGVAAHSMVPLEKLGTSGYTLGLLIAAHAVGWPVARGGSQNVSNALAAYFKSLGGEIISGARIQSLADLPKSRAVMCDVTPRQFLQLAGGTSLGSYGRQLERYRYGPGVFKMDWALNTPVPWTNAGCARSGTLHIGGTFNQIAAAERESHHGRTSSQPYVLAVQPSVFDATRAPYGKHTLWAYCHVPNGSTADMTSIVENQIETYAPGFRDCIEQRSTMFPADLERHNANLVGGDIAGGAGDLMQIIARPVLRFNQYKTSLDGVFLCSSSTPPGVGVHGMCGFYAAQTALGSVLS